MTERQLDRIEIEGYTSIRSASVTLGQLNVLVGANGAGKSNFIRALELLGRIVDNELNLFVGFNGGASALLNNSASPARIRLRLDAPPNAYEATLAAAANDELIFTEEVISFHRPGYERPWTTSIIGRGQRETRLHEAEQDKPVARYVIKMLRGCRVFHFHDQRRCSGQAIRINGRQPVAAGRRGQPGRRAVRAAGH